MQQINIAGDVLGVANEPFDDEDVIAQLSSFCRGEMSAVETYLQAIDVTKEEWILGHLRSNLASHQDRVTLLSSRIVELGGAPPHSSGAWGTFATALEGAAATFGEKSALSLLESGEDHGLNDYRGDLDNLDPESFRLVRDRILPEQVATHRALSEIKRLIS